VVVILGSRTKVCVQEHVISSQSSFAANAMNVTVACVQLSSARQTIF
jgi:hypothetical protein